MKPLRRAALLFSLLILSLPLLAGGPPPLSASGLKLSALANVETAGITLQGAPAGSRPEGLRLAYRPLALPTWQEGQPFTKLPDGRLLGSLFNLQPDTPYEVKVSDGVNEIRLSLRTQPEKLSFRPRRILYVDDNALAGGDGSVSAPYRTIQEAVDQASAGTQILVADGIYREAVQFHVSGAENAWIQVKAAGRGAILDSSTGLTGQKWNPFPGGEGKIWYLKLSRPLSYLGRDNARFYNFDSLSDMKKQRGHGKTTIKEGWFYDQRTSRLYVRTLTAPNRHTWQVPAFSTAFSVNGQNWVWIEGLEMRYYNCGVCAVNASHLVIRANTLQHCHLGVYVRWNGTQEQGNDTRIEENEMFDPPVNEWPWAAVKGTSMEGTAIVVRGHSGAIVRSNNLHHYFNGIYVGTSADLEDPETAWDVDVYRNRISHISDDALEPEGAGANWRFRENVIQDTLVGLSFAPVTQGPVWALRNRVSGFHGTSIKWARNSDGRVFLFHNTFWSNDPHLSAMGMITAVRNVFARNNIFVASGYLMDANLRGLSGHDWNDDNWFSSGAGKLRWEGRTYDTLQAFCAATGQECAGWEDVPGLIDPANGDFGLTENSPNRDRALTLPGINDTFSGPAPDVGAMEMP